MTEPREPREPYTFWALMNKSVLLSGFVAVAVISTMCYLAATSRPIPDVLSNVAFAIVAFFFGARMGGQETEHQSAVSSLQAALREQDRE